MKSAHVNNFYFFFSSHMSRLDVKKSNDVPDLNKHFLSSSSLPTSLFPPHSMLTGLKVAARGYAICKFKEGGESFFAKETEYVGRQQYVSESVNIFKCSADAPMLFKPDKYTYKF